MNNLNGISLKTIFNILKKNVLIFVSVFTIFLLGAIIGSKVLFSSCSVKASVLVKTNVDSSSTNYVLLYNNYMSTALGFLKDDIVLKNTANKYNLTTTDLRKDLDYSYSGEIISIVYEGGKNIEVAKKILDSIVLDWIDYTAANQISGVDGKLNIVSNAQFNEDLETKRKIFVFSMIFIGAVIGVVISFLKGLYWLKFDDESLVPQTIKRPIDALFKKSKYNTFDSIENELEFKVLMLNFFRTDSKVINFTSVDGKNKEKLIIKMCDIFEKQGNSVCVLDLDSSDVLKEFHNYETLSCDIFKIQGNGIEDCINNLKNKYDYVIASNDESSSLGKEFMLNKYADTTVIDIEIGRTRKTKLKNIINIFNKDNDNLLFVVSK